MEALEQEFAAQVSTIFNIAYQLVGIPYKLDSHSQYLKYVGAWKQKILFGLNLVVYTGYEGFVLWRCVNLVSNPEAALSDIANAAYNLCGNLLPLVLLIHVATSWGCHSMISNASIRHFNEVCGM